MVDIHSAAAEIRREKKKKEIEGKKPQGKNIMVCPITSGGHNETCWLTECDEIDDVETALEFGVLQVSNVDRLGPTECRPRGAPAATDTLHLTALHATIVPLTRSFDQSTINI